MKTSDIFWKCWWWSATCGAGIGILLLIITTIPIFDPLFRLIPFFDTLVILSVAGCYAGAGYVGSRIAAKHYTDHHGRYVKRYAGFSILSAIVLVAIAFSPLSFLMILWSLIAPYCVLLTLRGFTRKQQTAAAAPKRRSGARRRVA